MRSRNLFDIKSGTSFRYDPVVMDLVFNKIGKKSNLTNVVCFVHIDEIVKHQVYQVLDALEDYTMSDLLNDCLANYLKSRKNLAIDSHTHSFSEVINNELKEWLNIQ